MQLIISGALGHMGRTVAEQASLQGLPIAFGVDPAPGAAPFPLHPSFAAAPQTKGVIIDFAAPVALTPLLDYAVQHGVPAVLCTTGYTEEQVSEIEQAAKVIPVFRSANMSLGVALLRHLVQKAAQVLGTDFDAEIVEVHHNRKMDAPSGTALALRDALNAGYETPHQTVCGREGRIARRTNNEIGIHAVRGGTVTGEHEVCFFGPSERIKLCHSAENRSVFAAGAVRAALFLQGKEPGLYSMDDLIGNL